MANGRAVVYYAGSSDFSNVADMLHSCGVRAEGEMRRASVCAWPSLLS